MIKKYLMIFILIAASGCETWSVTHQLKVEDLPNEKVGVIFNTTNDVCVDGVKYDDLFDHRSIVVNTTLETLDSMGLEARAVDVEDLNLDAKTLTKRLWRSNTAEVLPSNVGEYEQLMDEFDILLVMEHDALTGSWMQGDCYGSISFIPYDIEGGGKRANPSIMWIFKPESLKSRGVGLYFHKAHVVPFPYYNPRDKDGIERYVDFYRDVIETEVRKAFINTVSNQN